MICGPVQLLLPHPDSECVKCIGILIYILQHTFNVLLSDRRVKLSCGSTWSKEETECLSDIGPNYPIDVPSSLCSMLSNDYETTSPDGSRTGCLVRSRVRWFVFAAAQKVRTKGPNSFSAQSTRETIQKDKSVLNRQATAWLFRSHTMEHNLLLISKKYHVIDKFLNNQ